MHGERSADFQSAVSQVFNLLKPRQGCRPDFESCMRIGRSADYKSAIQQIENLRYVCGKPETLQMRPRKAPAGRNDHYDASPRPFQRFNASTLQRLNDLTI